MAYNEKQRTLRRCRVMKADGSQCRAYSKIGADGRCALHLYDHKTKKLPKANEREATRIRRAKNVKPQKRATCSCSAYSFIHRLSSGYCQYPDPPRFRLVKKFGKKPSEKTPTSPGSTQNTKFHAGGRSEWERVINYEGPNEVETVADEERERLKRIAEQESLKEMTPHEALMSRIWRGEFDNNKA